MKLHNKTDAELLEIIDNDEIRIDVREAAEDELGAREYDKSMPTPNDTPCLDQPWYEYR